jgi:hypothetical protein
MQGEKPEGVEIEEVSDSLLRVTIDGDVFDVTVERIYHTHHHFGEFRSLDRLVEMLRRVHQEG